ncbi:MAG: hypothetical protein ACHQ7H_18140 [Candidatus Rokuibacteriota bacterium]
MASMHPLVVTLALVAGSGCASRQVTISAVPARPLRAATLEEVLAAHDAYCKGMDTLSASGDLDVRDFRAGKARKLGVRLVAARGGKLYLKASVAMITAIEVSSDGQQFWFQVPSRKTVWTGRADASHEAADDQAPYYALKPADVAAALLPEPIAPGPEETLLLEGDRDAFTLTVAAAPRGPVRRVVALDREALRPLRSRQYDGRGDIVSDFVYGEPGHVAAPARRVAVSRPREGYEAVFTFDKADANVPVPERAFGARTPAGYTVVEVAP